MSETYSFPNISFKEGIVGPAPQFKPWRNTIGVAATFRRRPAGVVRIRNSQEKILYFGDDNSPGCTFLNQALSQGATDFIVSPAIQRASSSTATIILAHPNNPDTELPVITDAVSGTKGFEVGIEYCGSVFTTKETGSVVTSTDSELFPATSGLFTGRGQLVYDVVRFIPSTENPGVVVSGSTASGSGHLLLTFSKATYSAAQLGAVKSGYRVSGSSVLSIESDLIDHSDTEWAVIVSGTSTSTALQAFTVLGPSTNTYVVAVSYSNVDGYNIPNLYNKPLASEEGSPVSYINISHTSADTNIPTKYHTYTGSGKILTTANTGISIKVSAYRDNIIYLRDRSQWVVPFAKSKFVIGQYNSVGTPLPVGTTSLDILKLLKASLFNNAVTSALIENYTLSDLEYPVSLTLKSTVKGADANNIRFYIARNGLGPSEFSISGTLSAFNTTYTKWSGAYKQESNASLTLWSSTGIGRPILKIVSVIPGPIGNSLRVTLNYAEDGETSITVLDTDSGNFITPPLTETYTLKPADIDKATGLYTVTQYSNLVRIYHVPTVEGVNPELDPNSLRELPLRLAPSIANRFAAVADNDPVRRINQGTSYINLIPLAGGTNSDLVGPPADYDFLLDAVKLLEAEDIAILACPDALVGVPAAAQVIKEIKDQCERSTVYNGQRVAVIGTTKDYPENLLATATLEYSSERLVLLPTYVKLASKPRAPFAPALGLYAGYLSVNEPHIHPQASGVLGPVVGVIAATSTNSPAYLDKVTKSRAEVLFYDSAFEYYHFLNGRTTSSDGNRELIAIRREQDRLQHEFYRALLPLRSMNIDENLYNRVATACDTILSNALANKRIRNFRPTICNAQNNTPDDVRRRIVNFTIRFEPLFPADFLRGTVIRDLTITETLTLETNQ